MEKGSGKETDVTNSSSLTTGYGSRSSKAKPRKKKKRCTCKGFSGDDSSADEEKALQKQKELSAWFREKQAWAKFIRRQQKDVRSFSELRHVKPIVDDAAPKLHVSNVYDVEILKNIWKVLETPFVLNEYLLRSIHEVNVLPGRTDTFKFNYSRVMYSNYAFRKEEAKLIEKENKFMVEALSNMAPKIQTVKQHAKEWKRHEAIVESSSQFPLWWKLKKREAAVEIGSPLHYVKQHVTEKSAKYPDKRPRVYLEVSIRNVGVVGRMVAMLYSDYVPMTVKNFLAFCNPKASLTYKGNLFYFIFQNYYCQTGDVVENRGFGGTSIYGPYFGNEDFTLEHKERGVLTMYSKIPNRNASQFLITFRKLESLDGKNVVFGKIVKGLHVLEAIEGVGSKKTGRPKVEIYISDCDEI